jgi:hypothetical protein
MATTMTISESLANAWASAKKDAGPNPGFYRRRVILPGAHVVYAGLLMPGATRQVSFEVPPLPADNSVRDRTRGYSVGLEPSDSGKPNWQFIGISEAGPGGTGELFGMLASDLVSTFAACPTPDEASRSLIRRLQHWKVFFQNRSEAGLNREEAIGLYAEIEFLEHQIGLGITPEDAVASWTGPMGTNQDFLFGSSAVEVKATVANDSGVIKISNLRQLDPTGLSHLFLRCCSYDFRIGSGRTLPQAVSALAGSLAASPVATATFHDRLLAAGYVEPLPRFVVDAGFTRRTVRHFRIDDGFPRLRESDIPPGVCQVEFAISLAACSSFEIAESAADATIRSRFHP